MPTCCASRHLNHCPCLLHHPRVYLTADPAALPCSAPARARCPAAPPSRPSRHHRQAGAQAERRVGTAAWQSLLSLTMTGERMVCRGRRAAPQRRPHPHPPIRAAPKIWNQILTTWAVIHHPTHLHSHRDLTASYSQRPRWQQRRRRYSSRAHFCQCPRVWRACFAGAVTLQPRTHTLQAPPSPAASFATGALKLFSLVQALAARQRRKLATQNMAPFVLSFGMEEYALALQVCFPQAAYAM